MGERRIAMAIVGLHYVANLAHGLVHGAIPVPLTALQNAFVVLAITIGPLLSLWLLHRERSTLGWATLAAVLLASVVFGVVFHYLIASPDHVANVPSGAWNGPFEATAALVALVDGSGSIAATWFARQAQRAGPTESIDSTT